MSAKKTCIDHGQIVLPDKIVRGFLLIEGNRIAEIGENDGARMKKDPGVWYIDAEDGYVMPGIIDIHSDALEKEIQPRPNIFFPIDMAFYGLEKKLSASGITTMYHSLSLSDDWGVRNKDLVLGMIKSIHSLKNMRSMIHHKIHLRYELTYLSGMTELEALIDEESIDYLSYMDHTPGQGQYQDAETLKNYMMQSYGRMKEDVEGFLDRTAESRALIDWPRLMDLAKRAKSKGVRLAFHDDDRNEKIDMLLACQGVVSEFPINMETALYAKSKGVSVCVGAPNIVRGQSHNNNLKALDAIAQHAADIICSDYLPGAMLPALFRLTWAGIELTEAVRMVTANPAKALGIDGEVGTIEVGKIADIIIVEEHQDYPVLRKTLVEGKAVYQGDFKVSNRERVEQLC
ncbi:alpha-D-ribose 1-methylphosphonate 5-triphosphate diphosphatase [Candidatus Formimonas warabiya]|uniref:Alpha-D-ribose 1-methylphosphonate 5-triphosphate diphosphatase n=1 Tax=Formimonas warabiya TaxID=1761012 RepID=A0A3G1KW13_FORW1|nr:alpha-D-ribose 1-methylphosphonate 5-triphosphate diphosphatase [Candidatus Formimonas warabiya]ATW26642.1 alpha-D-ribose 1-methylphosphonate 5-triphosphate diphosphatase [Candidatus Formimonas warabiya]